MSAFQMKSGHLLFLFTFGTIPDNLIVAARTLGFDMFYTSTALEAVNNMRKWGALMGQIRPRRS